MDLTPHEEAIVELLRAMGSDPLHVAFTSTGSGVAFALLSAETGPLTGWGPTLEEAMGNVFGIPDPEPQPQPPSRFRVVAGTDRPASAIEIPARMNCGV